jgi:predicted RNA-binding protein Jag
MLGDVYKHVSVNHAYESLQNELKNLVLNVLEHQKDFAKIFIMNHFMPLVDYLQGEVQVKVNKAILECFCRDASPTTDVVLINAMFEVGKIVHDSINSLSFEDEIRQISHLLSIFIKKINYGMDLEKQLNFYVECRRAFGNLDSLKSGLVIVATGLAMKTHQIIKGRHTKRTAAFVRVSQNQINPYSKNRN